jgi:hypothetical protein
VQHTKIQIEQRGSLLLFLGFSGRFRGAQDAYDAFSEENPVFARSLAFFGEISGCFVLSMLGLPQHHVLDLPGFLGCFVLSTIELPQHAPGLTYFFVHLKIRLPDLVEVLPKRLHWPDVFWTCAARYRYKSLGAYFPELAPL